MEREDTIAAVAAAADGALTGRVRLQKSVYLLDRLGLKSSFTYDYHHYGPYSRDLDNAVADPKAFGMIDETYEHRLSDGAMYSIFKLRDGADVKAEAWGDLGRERTGELVKRFVQYTSGSASRLKGVAVTHSNFMAVKGRHLLAPA